MRSAAEPDAKQSKSKTFTECIMTAAFLYQSPPKLEQDDWRFVSITSIRNFSCLKTSQKVHCYLCYQEQFSAVKILCDISHWKILQNGCVNVNRKGWNSWLDVIILTNICAKNLNWLLKQVLKYASIRQLCYHHIWVICTWVLADKEKKIQLCSWWMIHTPIKSQHSKET